MQKSSSAKIHFWLVISIGFVGYKDTSLLDLQLAEMFFQRAKDIQARRNKSNYLRRVFFPLVILKSLNSTKIFNFEGFYLKEAIFFRFTKTIRFLHTDTSSAINTLIPPRFLSCGSGQKQKTTKLLLLANRSAISSTKYSQWTVKRYWNGNLKNFPTFPF